MKKIFLTVLMISTLLLSGCWAAEKAGQFFGSETPPDKKAPAEQVADLLGLLGLGGGGLVAAAALRMGSKAVKAKNAVFDSIESAIDRGSLSNATTEKAVKDALAHAQSMHPDAKVIANAFKKWKNKKKSG